MTQLVGERGVTVAGLIGGVSCVLTTVQRVAGTAVGGVQVNLLKMVFHSGTR